MVSVPSFYRSWFKADYLFVTMSLFITVTLLGLITFNLTFFDPITKALTDFNFSDLLYSKLNTDQDALDTNIVLVNIGRLNRAKIAEQIRIIRKHKPKVIGFDGFFSGRRDSAMDAMLKVQISRSDIVLASYLTGTGELDGKFDKLEMSAPWFNIHSTGFVNLGGSDMETSTVRYFSPSEVIKGRSMYAWAVEVAKKFDPGAVQKLTDRNKKREIIHFFGNRQAFTCFDADEILDTLADLESIKGKIVLMGYMGESFTSRPDLEDIYYTPMNKTLAGRSLPDMHGVVIHANIIHMILARDYINSMPAWLSILLAFITCYFFVVFITWFNASNPLLFNVTFPVFLLFLNMVIVYIFFLLYKYCNYSIHSAYFLAPVILYKTFLTYYERVLLLISRHIAIHSIFLPKKQQHAA